jgi:hypothetical protein
MPSSAERRAGMHAAVAQAGVRLTQLPSPDGTFGNGSMLTAWRVPVLPAFSVKM